MHSPDFAVDLELHRRGPLLKPYRRIRSYAHQPPALELELVHVAPLLLVHLPRRVSNRRLRHRHLLNLPPLCTQRALMDASDATDAMDTLDAMAAIRMRSMDGIGAMDAFHAMHVVNDVDAVRAMDVISIIF